MAPLAGPRPEPSLGVTGIRRKTWRRVRAIVIWVAIPILIWVWTTPFNPTARAYISAAYASFILLAAPVWCGAQNRDGTFCRNNSTGLVGYHLRCHRWKKLTTFTRFKGARGLGRNLFRDPQSGAAVVGAVAAIRHADLPHWARNARPCRHVRGRPSCSACGGPEIGEAAEAASGAGTGFRQRRGDRGGDPSASAGRGAYAWSVTRASAAACQPRATNSRCEAELFSQEVANYRHRSVIERSSTGEELAQREQPLRRTRPDLPRGPHPRRHPAGPDDLAHEMAST